MMAVQTIERVNDRVAIEAVNDRLENALRDIIRTHGVAIEEAFENGSGGRHHAAIEAAERLLVDRTVHLTYAIANIVGAHLNLVDAAERNDPALSDALQRKWDNLHYAADMLAGWDAHQYGEDVK
jgi:hypothetical protein